MKAVSRLVKWKLCQVSVQKKEKVYFLPFNVNKQVKTSIYQKNEYFVTGSISAVTISNRVLVLIPDWFKSKLGRKSIIKKSSQCLDRNCVFKQTAFKKTSHFCITLRYNTIFLCLLLLKSREKLILSGISCV